MMKTTVKLDYPHLPAGRPFKVRLMLGLEASAVNRGKSKPLNLSVVIDRSGSMSGDKLRHVRAATRLLFGQLNSDDIFSIVAYDDNVRDVMSPTPVGSARDVDSKIASIHSGGSTFLSGGYLRGGEMAEQYRGNAYTSRILLLSDGLANHGVTEPESLARMASDMLSRGISTTTIGVGHDYNEFLMGQMAESGGGGAYFIENPDEAASVFQEELGYLKSLTATNVSVRFVTNIQGVRFDQLNSYKRIDANTYQVGDVYDGQRRSIVLEIDVPSHPVQSGVRMGDLLVSWHSIQGDGDQNERVEFPVLVDFVEEEVFGTQRPDREVMLEAAFLAVARAKREAITLADQKDFRGAARLLKDCAKALSRLALDDQQLEEEIREMHERARRFINEGEAFFESRERKRMYHEYDKSSKNFNASYIALKERRNPGGANADRGARLGAEHPCYLVNGHPIIETGFGRALLDSGAPTSIGRVATIRVDHQPVSISDSYMGQDIDSIGQLVGLGLEALLGMDVLGCCDWMIDLDRGVFYVGRSPAPHGWDKLPLRRGPMRVPIIEAEVAGVKAPLAFDTGAKLSYLLPTMLVPFQTIGTDTDFFPGFGVFSTDIRSIPVTLAGDTFTESFGELPPTLNMLLGTLQISGILGAALLNSYRVHFSATRGRIMLQRL
jgi:hypothetical protein